MLTARRHTVEKKRPSTIHSLNIINYQFINDKNNGYYSQYVVCMIVHFLTIVDPVFFNIIFTPRYKYITRYNVLHCYIKLSKYLKQFSIVHIVHIM